MKPPTALDIEKFFQHVYDPVKAHDYYVRNRKLKGRQPGSNEATARGSKSNTSSDPRFGKSKEEIHKDARAKQRAELSQQIKSLEDKLMKLKLLIRYKKAAQDLASRKSLGKKERAAKESTKPKTAAEKLKASRESKQYRDKHQQKVKAQAKARSSSKSGGGGSSTKTHHDAKSEARIVHLEALATKVSGKITVAKQKLAAL